MARMSDNGLIWLIFLPMVALGCEGIEKPPSSSALSALSGRCIRLVKPVVLAKNRGDTRTRTDAYVVPSEPVSMVPADHLGVLPEGTTLKITEVWLVHGFADRYYEIVGQYEARPHQRISLTMLFNDDYLRSELQGETAPLRTDQVGDNPPGILAEEAEWCDRR